jgi:hypothetical protein
VILGIEIRASCFLDLALAGQVLYHLSCASHPKVKRIETNQRIFSCHNGMKLEMNNKKIDRIPNIWKVNYTLLKRNYKIL